MASINFEKNKKEALKNIINDKNKSNAHINVINSHLIDKDTNLSLEYISLYSAFVYDEGESFPIIKYDCFRTMFLELRNALDLHIEDGEYDTETLERIMTHLSLELGTDIRFPETFQQMLSENMLNRDYSDLKEKFTFENLYQQYNKKTSHKKAERNLNMKDLYQLYEDKLKMDKSKYSDGYAKKLVVGETEFPEYPSEESQQKRGRKK